MEGARDGDAASAGHPAVGPRESWVVPILIAGYLIAYIAQVHRLPIAATLYPYLLVAVASLGLLYVAAMRMRLLFSRRMEEPASEQGQAANGGEAGHPLRARAGRPIAFLVLASLYPAVVTAAGFTITTFILLLSLLYVFGERRVLRSVLIAAVVSLAFFATVDQLLGIPLPTFQFVRLPYGI